MTVVRNGVWVRGLRAYWLLPVIAAAGLALTLADRESGLVVWYETHEELEVSRDRIAALNTRVDTLKSEIVALERDPFALERAIREELELARPGEIVVRFAPPSMSD
jgi:cell division protein FtsB